MWSDAIFLGNILRYDFYMKKIITVLITIEKSQFQKVKKVGLFRGFTNVALNIFENFKLFPANDLDFD